MEQGTISAEQALHAEQSAEWLRTTRGLAKRAGCEQAVNSSLSRVESLGRKSINVGIVGAPNSGKSTLMNDLLQRNLLPSSPIPSLTSFVIEVSPPGEAEKFVIANASLPLAQLAEALKSAQGAAIQPILELDNDWLRSLSLRLLEKPPLDADDKNLGRVIDACLHNSDLVMLVIDAIMPMKRSEVEVLRECCSRGIPVIAVLTKSAKLAEEERNTVLPYVEKQARQYVPDITVIDGTAELKGAITKLIQSTDFAGVRFEQLKYGLAAALDAISAAARAGAEAESKTQAERNTEINQRRAQIDAQNLVWLQIEQQLNQRRQKVEEQIRDHLTSNQQKVLDFLSYDLDKSSDIKTWWERDMPFRLGHDLRGQVAGISTSIDRQLVMDRKWLQEELHRQFGYPLVIGPEPSIVISETEVGGRPLALADAQKFKVVSRVGTAAVVIAAGTLFATTGIGGAVLAASLLAGLGAERWNNRVTSQNRDKVRAELNTLIGRACVHYAADISAKLKDWYDELIGAVKERQLQWQQAQIQALQTARQKGESASRPDWEDILRQSDSLLRQIRPQMTT